MPVLLARGLWISSGVVPLRMKDERGVGVGVTRVEEGRRPNCRDSDSSPSRIAGGCWCLMSELAASDKEFRPKSATQQMAGWSRFAENEGAVESELVCLGKPKPARRLLCPDIRSNYRLQPEQYHRFRGVTAAFHRPEVMPEELVRLTTAGLVWSGTIPRQEGEKEPATWVCSRIRLGHGPAPCRKLAMQPISGDWGRGRR